MSIGRRSNSSMKLITYSNELVHGKPFYASSNSLPVKGLNREPAGHAFHSAARKLHGYAEKHSDGGKGSNKKVGDDEEEEEYVPSFNPYGNKRKKKKKKEKEYYGTQQQHQQKQQDHYAVLGLRHLRYHATEDQIKKSYREAALKHHPDKLVSLILAEETEEAKEAKKEEIASRFRAIQEAYEVLMDPTKRKVFDSTDEFYDDDDTDDLSPEEFFKVFGPAFKRIAVWSAAGGSHQRVPDLGDENTELKEVDKFYSFWKGFKSLREFHEYDVDKADSRQERRWMERENAKKTAKARHEDDVRIRNLVDNAYRMDPRILKRKEEEEAKNMRKKEAKVMAKKKKEEEAAVAAAEANKRWKEEVEQLMKEKEKEKKLLLKERRRLRILSAHVLAQRLVSEKDVENLCMSLNIEQLQSLCNTMGYIQGLEELAKLIKDHEANKSKEKECEKENSEEKESEKVNNSKEREREKVNSKEKECEKANGGGEAEEPTKLDNTQRKKEPWSKEEIDKLRKGIIKYPKGTSRRWEVISDYIGTGRSVEDILKTTKTVLLQKPDSAKAFDSFLEKRKPSVTIASPLSTREEFGESIPMAKPPVKETVVGKSSDDNGEASGSSETDGWSVVQERALVQALKAFPKETSQRWERVAAAVPGKTMIQCKKKFAELKELIRSKKTGV